MLDQGLVEEVIELRQNYVLDEAMPSMRCVGYRQAWDVLENTLAAKELEQRGIFATRQLAKRQITWLRSMPQRQAIACDRPTAVADLVHAVLARLDGGAP